MARGFGGRLNQPKFEIVRTTAGAISIRNNIVGEIMHNPVGPWVEANALYIDQSNLFNLLSEDSERELVLFDVGLGAAANSLAALACAKRVSKLKRPFHIVSFEKDLELLKFALAHSREFDHFKGYESALETLLSNQSWSEGSIRWDLRVGEFLDLIDLEPTLADVIFYDPYSPKVNQEMWTTDCFRKLHGKCRSGTSGGAKLLTYSQATRIRAALIEAGFFVGYGQSTGLKEQTTEATTHFELLKNPLDQKWFQRWDRSHIRYPFGCVSEGEVDLALAEYKRQQGY